MFSIASAKQPRISVKFCFKVEKTAAENQNMLHKTYDDDVLHQMTTYELFKCFKNGRT
jgi:hypothetical protein